ncbi:MAG: hypothetical protein ACTHW1_05215 [Ancrocorticia sp.]|uniref:hypothetical protein n=1 Tax=Ancrocorticia sp. TaxID=2593684 RepID=UPI003F8F4DEE
MISPKLTLLIAIGLSGVLVSPVAQSASYDDRTWDGNGTGNIISVEGTWQAPASPGAPASNPQPRYEQPAGPANSGGVIQPAGPVCDYESTAAQISCAQALRLRDILNFGNAASPASAPASAGNPLPAIEPASLITASDIQTIVANEGSITVSPNRGWVYINKPVYFETDAVAYTETLTILGQTVTVHLTPESYLWDPGDGSATFTSTDPGGPWPDGKVTHTYLAGASQISINLTVTWTASFTVGGTSYPVDGTATSTTQSDSFEVREAEAVLTK